MGAGWVSPRHWVMAALKPYSHRVPGTPDRKEPHPTVSNLHPQTPKPLTLHLKPKTPIALNPKPL